MIRTTLTAALIALATPAAAQVLASIEPARPVLKRQAFVAGDIVRIGDLIDNAGIVADVPIFRAPDLGQTGSVEASRVLEAIRPHRLVDIETGGLAEVTVTRTSRVITVRQLEERIAAALAGQSGLGAAKDLTVTFDREARPIHVDPSATGELKIARLSLDPAGWRFDAAFDLPGSTAQRAKLRYTGSVVETPEAVVALRAVGRGEVIRASDVAIERRPKATLGTGVIDRPEQIVGFAARRALRVGQPLRANDLMKPEIVRQNETVTIVYEVPGLFLSVRGKAIDSGAEGDLVSVLNVQSKRTVQGTVTGPGRVSVAATTPRIIEASGASAEPASVVAAAQQPE